jgi:hypothetical protein
MHALIIQGVTNTLHTADQFLFLRGITFFEQGPDKILNSRMKLQKIHSFSEL